MSIDRRQFERLSLTDETVAVDEAGQRLGKVTQASGGGMMIHAETTALADSMAMGSRHRVTIMEPGSQTAHTIDVVVRYREGDNVGVEFVTGKEQ